MNINFRNAIQTSRLNIQKISPSSLICYAIKKQENIIAYIHFKIIDNKAISLPESPFGGIAMLDNIDIELIGEFIGFVIAALKESKIEEIEIRLSPDCYEIMNLENTLYKQGFKKLYSEINQHLKINKTNFRSKLNADKKYRLNLCSKAGFHSRLLKNDELHEAYLVIEENLTKKGFPLSLSWNNINTSTKSFPDRYLAFGTFDKEKIIQRMKDEEIADGRNGAGGARVRGMPADAGWHPGRPVYGADHAGGHREGRQCGHCVPVRPEGRRRDGHAEGREASRGCGPVGPDDSPG